MNDENQLPLRNLFPNLSLQGYFWLMFFVQIVIIGLGAYSIGMRTGQANAVNATQISQISFQQKENAANPPGKYDAGDIDYSTITGVYTTDADYYDQTVIYVDEWKNGSRTNLQSDNRVITRPQDRFRYPYAFLRLNPFTTYVISASACHTNEKGSALDCARKITVSNCSGMVQGNTCVIKGNGDEIASSGEVNFSVTAADNSQTVKKGEALH